MASIHLIEKLKNQHPVKPGADEWESGSWVIGEATAASLIGGSVFFHETQQGPAYFGGTIIGFRPAPPPDADRLVIIFTPSNAAKGALAGAGGWGNEKKLV